MSTFFASFTLFFFNDTATTDIYTLSLHDALPILGVVGYTLGGGLSWLARKHGIGTNQVTAIEVVTADGVLRRDRKSTRLNSSHPSISYAVFCLKKKKANKLHNTILPETHLRLYEV